MGDRFSAEHDPTDTAPNVTEYPMSFATLADPMCGPSGADCQMEEHAMSMGEEYDE